MDMSKWVKMGETIKPISGDKEIEYCNSNFEGVKVCSHLIHVPRANGGSGCWAYRKYSVEAESGFCKEFTTLREAKAFVENGGLK